MMRWCLTALAGACLIFTVTAVPASADEAPQLVISADRQFSYADILYQKEDHETAAVEFKRFMHFFPGDPRVGEAEFKTGMALFYQKKFYDAARQFDAIIRKDKTDWFSREAYFMQSRAFMEMGNPGYAQTILQNYLQLTDDQNIRDRIYRDLARLHMHASRQAGTDELDQAQEFVEKISETNAEQFAKKQTMALISDARNVPEKKPFLAGLFSIIPGGGFLYCERYQDALVSFGLNAGLMLAAYTAFDDGNSALGGVIGFVGAGFYSGSIYGSVAAVHKYNHAQRLKILNRNFSFGSVPDPCGRSFLFSFHYPF